MSDIDRKLIDLKDEKDKKESELRQIKDEWIQQVKAKARDQKYDQRLKKRRISDCFSENPLLLNDYLESIKKDKIIKKVVTDLRQELSEVDYPRSSEVLQKLNNFFGNGDREQKLSYYFESTYIGKPFIRLRGQTLRKPPMFSLELWSVVALVDVELRRTTNIIEPWHNRLNN